MRSRSNPASIPATSAAANASPAPTVSTTRVAVPRMDRTRLPRAEKTSLFSQSESDEIEFERVRDPPRALPLVTREAEHFRDDGELGVVEFCGRRETERLLDDLARVVRRPQVEIEKTDRIGARSRDESADRPARHRAPLSQRPEVHRVDTLGGALELRTRSDEIPRRVLRGRRTTGHPAAIDGDRRTAGRMSEVARSRNPGEDRAAQTIEYPFAVARPLPPTRRRDPSSRDRGRATRSSPALRRGLPPPREAHPKEAHRYPQRDVSYRSPSFPSRGEPATPSHGSPPRSQR